MTTWRSTLRPSSGLLRLALGVVLLLAVSLDAVHEHPADSDSNSCYTCHFSPDPGLAAGGLTPAEPRDYRSLPARRRDSRPVPVPLPAYDARGPPLLS